MFKAQAAERKETNDFPKLGINTDDLMDAVHRLLDEAKQEKSEFGAVNWGDLGIADIEYRMSMLSIDASPSCHVIIEEAAPDSLLASWLYNKLDKEKFPNTYFECEW